uniref:Uncharacterized protein n=1 Tax=Rhizophora mucronata TaxID=61149 RepID=A0A2P2KXP0_RHIMU
MLSFFHSFSTFSMLLSLTKFESKLSHVCLDMYCFHFFVQDTSLPTCIALEGMMLMLCDMCSNVHVLKSHPYVGDYAKYNHQVLKALQKQQKEVIFGF